MNEEKNNPTRKTNVWKESAMCFLYTLTPTHCGIGQTASSVDLPIARDVVSGMPILPATALKGVAREACEKDPEFKNLVSALFGPEIEIQEERANASGDLFAAGLAFTEGRLVAYPVRSLNHPFLHVTCPLILEMLARDARLIGNFDPPTPDLSDAMDRVHVADKGLSDRPLGIEDLIYDAGEVHYNEQVADFAHWLAENLPASEQAAKKRLRKGIVVIPDNEFCDLIQRTVPVRARTRLTKGKTADKWLNPETGETESGNLWYEEYLPSDTVFIAFIGRRRQIILQNNDKDSNQEKQIFSLDDFINRWKEVSVVQIGGNETIGNGICLWQMQSGKGGQ